MLVDKIIMGIFISTSLAVAGLFIYTEKVYKRPGIDIKNEEMQLLNSGRTDGKSSSVPQEKIIINLSSDGQRLRFLQLQLELVPFKQEYSGLFKPNQAMINDAIIDVAGQMSPDELNTLSGKILLEERIKNKLNKAFKLDAVREIYFTQFVVQ